ncbi:hypothetical protein [Xanthomonas vesicatoria]|uniref:Uncharacterized protein n=1 Tax=Xanthomonas vesicatoria ATCC 35937 TaxID=925775 RepID=F0BKZ1_9XANT|nr:hypothetical protein [Xanthomonas vesicatoria]APP76839.1 hypothetical protein BJD12_18225 [Xanthomonas vesicatoria ATCC 35937]EGD06852.1 hypothetical protein XVE_4957 [Xanthomonas vesicatoria ATCC 35937]KTF30430.1 hypothetical protein LMG919_21150 [Xanthomonas vesicatoria]KTF30990.1 hypothetical protein LMG920_17600 [Xanthomonas vesicatoria]MCC8560290.1 hypothetical protein [Xanthomonas vesicatoria]
MSDTCTCSCHNEDIPAEQHVQQLKDADADAFDQSLKRFVELMKCMALGVSFGIGGSAVAASGIADRAKVVGVAGCAIGGALAVTCAVLIFVKPYMHNVPSEWRARAKGVSVFSALVLAASFTFFITMDVIKDARRDRPFPESCVGSDSKFNRSGLIVKY